MKASVLWLSLAEFRANWAYPPLIMLECAATTVRVAALGALWQATSGNSGPAPAAEVVLGMSIYSLASTGLVTDMGVRIREGDLATDMVRPMDIQTTCLARAFGQCAFQALTQAIPACVVGAVIFPMHFGSLFDLTLGAVSILLGALILNAFDFVLGVLTLWTENIFSLPVASRTIVQLASGAMIPLAVLPPAAGRMLQSLPFGSAISAPSKYLLGIGVPEMWWRPLLVQLVWIIVFLLVGRIVWVLSRARFLAWTD